MLAATHTTKSRVETLKMRFVLDLRMNRCLSVSQPGPWRKVACVFSIIRIEIVMCRPSGFKLESSLEALTCPDVVARCCELALNNRVNIAVRKTDKWEPRVVAGQGELKRLLAVSQYRGSLPVVRRQKVCSNAHVCAGVE